MAALDLDFDTVDHLRPPVDLSSLDAPGSLDVRLLEGRETGVALARLVAERLDPRESIAIAWRADGSRGYGRHYRSARRGVELVVFGSRRSEHGRVVALHVRAQGPPNELSVREADF